MSEPIEVPQGEASAMPWPDPQPLVSKVLPEPYPIDALPPSVRDAVEEVHGFVKAPVVLVASSALGALSLAIQAHHDMKRSEKLSGPVSLFLLSIADSGERKSTCDGFFTKAIREYESQQAEASKPLLRNHAAAIESWEARRKGITDQIRTLAKKGSETKSFELKLQELEQSKPIKPRVPRLIHGDVTPEELKWSLATAWPSGGVVSSEAGMVLGSHAMGKDSVMRNLSTLNLLWDGADLHTERRTSESFTLSGARLTIALQVQEATLQSFFDQSGALARGSGFLARFLVAWPESTQGFRPFTEAPDTWPNLGAFNRRIAALLNHPAPINGDGALTPQVLTFAPDTKDEWVAFHDRIEGQLASGGKYQNVRDVASKITDNAARMSALFHVFEGESGPVGVMSFRAARRIVEWHLNEALRFFGELALPTELANAARLDSWLMTTLQRKAMGNSIPVREVQQFGPSCLRTKSALGNAIGELIELNRARLITGRPKLIAVNPSLLDPATATTATFATVPIQAVSHRSNRSESSSSSILDPIIEEGCIDDLDSAS